MRLRVALANTLLVLSSCAAGLAIMEAYLTVDTIRENRAYRKNPSHPYALAAQREGLPFDRRTALEVMERARQEGSDLVPMMLPSMFLQGRETCRIQGRDIIPLGGISRAPTLLGNESGEWIVYGSDEHGFNNPAGLHGGGAVEVVALGDSYAHGCCVPVESMFVTRIRQRIPGTLNLAMADNSLLTELASFIEYGAPLRPRNVLWFYYEGNDLDNLPAEMASPVLRKYLEDGFSQGLRAIQPEIDSRLRQVVATRIARVKGGDSPDFHDEGGEAASELVAEVKSALRLRHLRERLGLQARSGRSYGKQLEGLRQILARLKREVRAAGGELHFVYLPEWRSFASPRQAVTHRDAVLEVVRAADVPVIDVFLEFSRNPDPVGLFPFRLHGHYTAEGHRIVAEAVLARLGAGRR